MVKISNSDNSCGCKKLCFQNVNKQTRKAMKEKLAKMSYEEKNRYLSDLLQFKECHSRRKETKGLHKPRLVSMVYSAPSGSGEVIVCRKAFASIFGIGNEKIRELFRKIMEGDLKDNRGKLRWSLAKDRFKPPSKEFMGALVQERLGPKLIAGSSGQSRIKLESASTKKRGKGLARKRPVKDKNPKTYPMESGKEGNISEDHQVSSTTELGFNEICLDGIKAEPDECLKSEPENDLNDEYHALTDNESSSEAQTEETDKDRQESDELRQKESGVASNSDCPAEDRLTETEKESDLSRKRKENTIDRDKNGEASKVRSPKKRKRKHDKVGSQNLEPESEQVSSVHPDSPTDFSRNKQRHAEKSTDSAEDIELGASNFEPEEQIAEPQKKRKKKLYREVDNPPLDLETDMDYVTVDDSLNGSLSPRKILKKNRKRCAEVTPEAALDQETIPESSLNHDSLNDASKKRKKNRTRCAELGTETALDQEIIPESKADADFLNTGLPRKKNKKKRRDDEDAVDGFKNVEVDTETAFAEDKNTSEIPKKRKKKKRHQDVECAPEEQKQRLDSGVDLDLMNGSLSPRKKHKKKRKQVDEDGSVRNIDLGEIPVECRDQSNTSKKSKKNRLKGEEAVIEDHFEVTIKTKKERKRAHEGESLETEIPVVATVQSEPAEASESLKPKKKKKKKKKKEIKFDDECRDDR